MERRGILVAFEGIDGAGKTTQLGLLADALRRAELDVVTSREPTDGPHGRRIRESATKGRMPLDEELQAFVLDRTQHVRELITPSLDDGRIVILDRYFYSSVAYQGARGGDTEAIDTTMRGFAPIPDVVFYIDIDPAHSISRISDVRHDTPNEFEKHDALAASRAIFQKLCFRNDEMTLIDGNDPIARIHDTILHAFLDGPMKKRFAEAEAAGEAPLTGAHDDWDAVRAAVLSAGREVVEG